MHTIQLLTSLKPGSHRVVGPGPTEVLLQVFVVLSESFRVLGGALLHQQLALVQHVVGVAEDPGQLVKQLRLPGEVRSRHRGQRGRSQKHRSGAAEGVSACFSSQDGWRMFLACPPQRHLCIPGSGPNDSRLPSTGCA